MKLHLGFLSFCLLLAVILLSSPLQAAFKIDVHINGAENPTLTFGEADTRACSPHPPFSGMFGVADVCFANPGNTEEWFDRLAEDIKTAKDANQWILVAKSNARLTFNLTSGSIPDGLKIVYNDPKSGDKKTAAMADDLSFAVKTGGVYTITRGETPAPDPNEDSNKFMAKGEPGDITITLPEDFAPTTMKISFGAGIGVFAHFGEPDNEDLDINPRALTLADVDWIITVTNAVKYDWDASYTELTVTLSGTRGVGDVEVSMTPNRSSAPPIQTTITTFGNSDPITNVIDWILQKFGTLNVNQDTQFTTVDVLLIDAFQKALASAYDETENIDLALEQLSVDKIKALLKGSNKNFVTEEAFDELLNSWEEFAGIDGVDGFTTADVLVIDAIQKAFGNLFSDYEDVSKAVENLSLDEIQSKLKSVNKNFATEYSVEQGKALIDL